MSLRDLAERRDILRERKREIKEEEKAITAEVEQIDHELFAILDEQGLDRMSVGGITLSIGEDEFPDVFDWELFNAHIKRTDSFHLYQRRPAAGAYRELIAQGIEIPGVRTTKKRVINMRVTR